MPMPEVPPVMMTVLSSKIFIVGAQGSLNRARGQLADSGKVGRRPSRPPFFARPALFSGHVRHARRVGAAFRQLLPHLKDVLLALLRLAVAKERKVALRDVQLCIGVLAHVSRFTRTSKRSDCPAKALVRCDG